jgi:glucokinase
MAWCVFWNVHLCQYPIRLKAVNELVLDIGGTKCAVAHSDQLDQRYEILTRDYAVPSEILSELGHFARTKAFTSMGISFGGPFDFEAQKVMRSVHVSGWEDFSFSDWAQKEFGVVAIADNDANVGALGEFVSRGSDLSSLVYVTISTGIGAGMILNGLLYRGQKNLAGELGHTVIDPTGPADEMGNLGTLERLCSGYWLEKDFGRPAIELLADDEFLVSYANNLSLGLGNLIRLLNPELIVLGGGITGAGPRLENLLKENMSKLLSESGSRIEFSTLGSTNVLIGARELARN